MHDDALHGQPKAPPRWLQLLGWFLIVELVANGVIVATVSVVGWDAFVRANRVLIQIVVVAIALIAATLLTLMGVAARLLTRRGAPDAALMERSERLSARVEQLERLVAEAQTATVHAERAQWEAEQAFLAIKNAPNPIQQLAASLQTVIAADEVERQSAHLWRCHRNARDELVCTLPLGRRHGIAEGVEFTVVDRQESQTMGRFRVTGTADTFAACTLMEGTGWLDVAEQYGDAPLPPHELHFALPDVVRGMDARTADAMLHLLAALTPNGARTPHRAMAATPREAAR
jgi:membrane protein implicated in regulation of membrane protease activity